MTTKTKSGKHVIFGADACVRCRMPVQAQGMYGTSARYLAYAKMKSTRWMYERDEDEEKIHELTRQLTEQRKRTNVNQIRISLFVLLCFGTFALFFSSSSSSFSLPVAILLHWPMQAPSFSWICRCQRMKGHTTEKKQNPSVAIVERFFIRLRKASILIDRIFS